MVKPCAKLKEMSNTQRWFQTLAPECGACHVTSPIEGVKTAKLLQTNINHN